MGNRDKSTGNCINVMSAIAGSQQIGWGQDKIQCRHKEMATNP